MAAKIGSLIIDLALEYGLLKSGLSASEKEVAKTAKAIEKRGREMADFGKKLSVAVTLPILGLAASSIKAAKESADALGQVNAALTSMGNQAGRTTEQLQALAGSQMKQSLYDDDEILRKVTANLLTFGKVSGEQFDRAQQAALDLATRMNGDLQGATIQIGKALQDPVKGVMALKKVGIDFSTSQKAMIASLMKTGDVAGAQKIILAELEKQFKGSAKAARDADPGAAMAQSFANFQEEIGAKLLPLLPAFTDAITGVLDAFSSLPDGAQQAIIVLGGLAAAIGPAAIALGGIIQASAGTVAMFSTLGLTFGGVVAAAAPFVAVAAAIGAAAYLIYTNWDKIAPVLEQVWVQIEKILGPPIQKLVGSVTALLTQLWEGPLGEMIRTVIGVLGELAAAHTSVLGEVIPRILNAALSIIGSVFEQIGNMIDLVAALLRGDFAGAWQAVKAIVETAVNGVLRVIVAAFPEATKHVMALYVGVKTWLQDKMGAVFDWVGKKIVAVTGFFFDMYDAVVGHSYVPDMVDGIAAEFARLQSVMVVPAKKAANDVKEANRQMASDVLAILDRLYPEMAKARHLKEELAKIDGSDMSESARRRVRLDLVGEAYGKQATVSSWLTDKGPSESSEKVREHAEKLVDTMVKARGSVGVQTVQIAESFKDMADKSIQALDRMLNAFKGGSILDILGSVIGFGLQLGGMGAFGKSIAANINAPRIPGNANGTAFHPGGLMKVGERGAEILQVPRGGRVVPNHELREAGQSAIRIILDERTDIVAARIDGRIAATAGAIASAGASMAQSQMASSARRRIR